MTRGSCLITAVIGLLMAMASTDVSAEQIVREFSGDRSKDTVEFEVKAPWLIDWLVNTDYPGEMGLAIVLINAGSETYAGRVVKTKSPGDGLRLMNESGRFRFKIDAALARWNIKVVQLTEEEVELYRPKSAGALQ